MTGPDPFRPSLDRLAARLQRDVARHIDAACEELAAHTEKQSAVDRDHHTSALRAAADLARAEASSMAAREMAEQLAAHDARERAALDRVLNALSTFDRASSLSEVLAALAVAAAAEARRAAIFHVRDADIRSWRFEGFEPAIGRDDALTLSSHDAGLMATAVAEARTMRDVDGASAPPFADLPRGRRALAVPVLVNSEVVAVVYADEGADHSGEHGAEHGAEGRAASATWMSLVELLVRYAARALEALTAQRLAHVLTERARPVATGGAA